ncbi:hypothetical protein BH10ACT6_BH10ACT6_10540 [soil metagenome]
MSNASLTPTGGWYADPLDAAQLRWWDGFAWTQQTTPASAAEPLAPVTPITVPVPPATVPSVPVPPAAAADDGPGIYIPRNSVFKMAEAVDGQAYVPEWSGIADISDEVALSGVPVQLALTATPSEGPPIPVSADAFPILGLTPEPDAAPEPPAPVWEVEAPLAKPIDELFPLAGPAAFAAVPAATPTGDPFPGLVPTATEPEPELAPVPIPALAAVPALVETPEPAGFAPEPATPKPVAQPELYAGPALVAAPVPAPFDAPSPALAPMVPTAEASDADYEPLVARAIPQPAMLSAPVETLASDAEPATAPSLAAPVAAPVGTGTAWPAEGTYQPHPGTYVPFDPNAVPAQNPVPVMPVIPFSSRDPYNPASTSRPALRSYGGAPVGPSGSTYTPALVIILLAPLLMAGGYALLFQLALINVGLAPNLAVAGLLVALFFIGIGAAQFDRNTLAKRGYFDLASPFWILLSPLVYLCVRASRLHSQGSGGIRAVLLWFAAWAGAAAILTFSTLAALTAVTPDRIAQTEQLVAQSFVTDKVTPTVDCPAVPSFAPGTVFTCTATSGSTVKLVQVTITGLTGGESYKLVSTTTSPGATTP